MSQSLISYSRVLEIVGDIMKVSVTEPRTPTGPVTRLGDLALVEDESGATSLAKRIKADGSEVSLQVFSGT